MEMEENQKKEVQETENQYQSYIDEINKIKENSVSLTEYEELKKENKTLIENLVNGEGMKNPNEEQDEPVDIQKLRREMFNAECELNNLQWAEKSLELRDAVLAQGGRDPMLPAGHNIVVTAEDEEEVENYVSCLKHCIDYAQGDSEAFTNELQRLTVDTAPRKLKKR